MLRLWVCSTTAFHFLLHEWVLACNGVLHEWGMFTTDSVNWFAWWGVSYVYFFFSNVLLSKNFETVISDHDSVFCCDEYALQVCILLGVLLAVTSSVGGLRQIIISYSTYKLYEWWWFIHLWVSVRLDLSLKWQKPSLSDWSQRQSSPLRNQHHCCRICIIGQRLYLFVFWHMHLSQFRCSDTHGNWRIWTSCKRL